MFTILFVFVFLLYDQRGYDILQLLLFIKILILKFLSWSREEFKMAVVRANLNFTDFSLEL